MNDRFRFRVWGISQKKFENKKTVEDARIGFLPKVSSNYILEQCTGLKDKNGRLIYEGDIVYCEEFENIGIVKFDEEAAKFAIDVKGVYCDFTEFYSSDYTIKGNIHENPELLENK